MTQSEYKERARFVSKLGIRLHKCGATSHRIEKHLLRLCELLGIHGTFCYTPTCFTFSYWLGDSSDQLVLVERMKPSGGDLGQLERLDSLITSFEYKELCFADMLVAFDQDEEVRGYYSGTIQCVAWVTVCVCFAAVFSPNMVDALVSGLISMCVFFLTVAMSRNGRFSAIIEVASALVSGLLASGMTALGIDINVPLVVLSSVIVHIPGLSLTVALSEIAMQDLVSGTSKLVDAIMGLFKLYIGALLGIGLGALIWPEAAHEWGLYWPFESAWKAPPLLILLSLSILIVMNGSIKLAPWCLLSASIGFVASQYAGAAFGTVLGMFLGAFSVGVYANWFSNFRNKPASIVLIQGLVVLVPGSKTYMVVNSWVTGEKILNNGPSINDAFLTFISLVIGLLLANAVLPSKKSL